MCARAHVCVCVCVCVCVLYFLFILNIYISILTIYKENYARELSVVRKDFSHNKWTVEERERMNALYHEINQTLVFSPSQRPKHMEYAQ